MPVVIRYFTAVIVLSFLAACTSKPVKHATSDPIITNRLQLSSLPNKLPIPVDNIKPHQLKDTWGASRSSGRVHEGIDILASRGTKVYSTTDGIVRSMQDNKLGGTVIWILGPAGSWHYYAHLDRHHRNLREGDYVKKGDLIGYVGNTGNARHTSPHLHYGIYLQGRGRGAVNPYPYLR